MKKNITILMSLLFVLVTSQAFAQYEITDFEPAGLGAGYAWTVTENGTNPALAFIANPVSGGVNTSATVTEFTAELAGNPWALTFTDDITPFTFDATNHMVKIMVYKPTISNVGIKFEDGAGGYHEILVANTVINQWEELTYDFSAKIGSSYNRLVIIPDFVDPAVNPRTQDNLLYFDNVQVPSGGGTTGAVDSVDVTFQLNATTIATDAAGLFLAGGGTFGNPGDNAMADPDGDDVWTITVRLPKGMATDYTFTNGACGDWSCKEVITGLACAVAPWDDRNFPGAWADTTVLACFGNCISDGTCGTTSGMVNVTFQVDMSGETVDAAGVFLGGNFENWTGAQVLTDADADNVWEITMAINEGSAIEWKFINGANWGAPEDLDSVIDVACTQAFPGGFVNRVAQLGSSDTTLPSFLFGTCDITSSTKTIFTKDELFSINPTLVSSEAIINFKEEVVFADKQIQVINAVGQVVMTETIGQAQQYRLNAANLANGLYFVVIQSEGFAQTARILVSK